MPSAEEGTPQKRKFNDAGAEQQALELLVSLASSGDLRLCVVVCEGS